MAEQNAHQGRLAGAIFPQKGNDLAFGKGQGNVVIGEIVSEAFADAFYLENR
jgi:hypothetical protein